CVRNLPGTERLRSHLATSAGRRPRHNDRLGLLGSPPPADRSHSATPAYALVRHAELSGPRQACRRNRFGVSQCEGHRSEFPDYENPFRVSGNSRTRLPVAANTALQRAGTNGGTPGSPTPAGGAVLSTMWMSTCRGASFIRAT